MEAEHKRQAIKEKAALAKERLKSCTLCPRNCRVNRTKGEKGRCTTLDKAIVSSAMPHFGEEPPLSGMDTDAPGGSGTIFFSHCNLKCTFCQNYAISIQGHGQTMEPEDIAHAMLHLQQQGCHNINFVTPTHVVPFILEAIDLAWERGLVLPLVYNTSGYESPETLELLSGIMDIYLPDFKFWNPELAKLACNAPDYPEAAQKALIIMQNQTGDLAVDGKGIAQSGLLIRHLVMPGTLDDIHRFLHFVVESISPNARINLMSQYRPLWQAKDHPQFSNSLEPREYRRALKMARDLGLHLIR